eukprot:127959_1
MAEEKKEAPRKIALIIVDMQYDFMPPDGSLQVKGGDELVAIVNDLRKKHEKSFDLVALSMDWHPPNHCSFLSNNIKRVPEAKAFEICKLENGTDQVMWPNHCVQGSNGAKIHKDLTTQQSDKIILKGMDPAVDTYSAFMDNDKKSKTALHGLCQEAEITDIVCIGIAYDVCVGNTALDGAALGYKTYIVKEGAASVSKEGEEAMEKKFEEAKVTMTQIADLDEILKK